MKRIFICCDSFKGTLSSFEANNIIATELSRAGFDCETLPMADGGEGSLDLIKATLKVEKHIVQTYTPDHRTIISFYYTQEDKAYIDSASAGGLTLVNVENRKPLKLSSYGTGLLLKHAIDNGAKQIDLFLGGSATVDGGTGILYGLINKDVPNCNPLIEMATIEQETVKEMLRGIKVNIITDVSNPILGKLGAAKVFGPQKGALPHEIELLEENMEKWVGNLEHNSNVDLKNIDGLGAAGGMALPFAAYAISKIENGYQYFSHLLKYSEALDRCDVLITGEGCIDEQTMMGKGPGQLALQAREKGKIVLGIGGSVKEEPLVFNKIFSTIKDLLNLEGWESDAKERLQKTAKMVGLYIKNGS